MRKALEERGLWRPAKNLKPDTLILALGTATDKVSVSNVKLTI